MERKAIELALGAIKFVSKQIVETVDRQRYKITKAYMTGENTFYIKCKPV